MRAYRAGILIFFVCSAAAVGVPPMWKESVALDEHGGLESSVEWDGPTGLGASFADATGGLDDLSSGSDDAGLFDDDDGGSYGSGSDGSDGAELVFGPPVAKHHHHAHGAAAGSAAAWSGFVAGPVAWAAAPAAPAAPAVVLFCDSARGGAPRAAAAAAAVGFRPRPLAPMPWAAEPKVGGMGGGAVGGGEAALDTLIEASVFEDAGFDEDPFVSALLVADTEVF